jgi:MYXO-CTERM domain-containing protein
MVSSRSSFLSPSLPSLSLAVVAAAMFCGSAARADDECPLGSVQKTESGQTWCEPTVCEIDNQCPTGSVCRPVALCLEIGALATSPGSKDAGQKVLVRQRCGANKSCPQNTTCSEKSRCITRAQADKAGLAVAAGAGSATPVGSGGAAAPADAPKKACGCHAVGSSSGDLGGGALALVGAIAIAARRRRSLI